MPRTQRTQLTRRVQRTQRMQRMQRLAATKAAAACSLRPNGPAGAGRDAAAALRSGGARSRRRACAQAGGAVWAPAAGVGVEDLKFMWGLACRVRRSSGVQDVVCAPSSGPSWFSASTRTGFLSPDARSAPAPYWSASAGFLPWFCLRVSATGFYCRHSAAELLFREILVAQRWTQCDRRAAQR